MGQNSSRQGLSVGALACPPSSAVLVVLAARLCGMLSMQPRAARGDLQRQHCPAGQLCVWLGCRDNGWIHHNPQHQPAPRTARAGCVCCRSIPTTSNDRIYCKILAHNAVHAAFAGYTGITVGLVNTHYVYLPIPVIIQAPRKVDPRGKMWNRLRASIGQPSFT